MTEPDELAALKADLREVRHERAGETRRADVAQEQLARSRRGTVWKLVLLFCIAIWALVAWIVLS